MLQKIHVEVDIFPYKREMKAKGQFLFKNKYSVPIQTLFVAYPSRFVREFSMEWGKPVSLLEKNESLGLGLSIYKLEKPLNPGEDLLLKFQVAIAHPGFINGKIPKTIFSNGTFFHNSTYFPFLGYSPFYELSGDKVRKKYGLNPKEDTPKINDEKARKKSFLEEPHELILKLSSVPVRIK